MSLWSTSEPVVLSAPRTYKATLLKALTFGPPWRLPPKDMKVSWVPVELTQGTACAKTAQEQVLTTLSPSPVTGMVQSPEAVVSPSLLPINPAELGAGLYEVNGYKHEGGVWHPCQMKW